jgi:hypothetical protein
MGILQVVREHYLRDDIQSGTPLDPACPADSHKLSASAQHYLVIDTNIALQQVGSLPPPPPPAAAKRFTVVRDGFLGKLT